MYTLHDPIWVNGITMYFHHVDLRWWWWNHVVKI